MRRAFETSEINWIKPRQKGSDALNTDNLHELINRYEENLDKIYNAEHDELFKWRAMKTWQNEWFKPEGSFSSFAERFAAAKSDFSLFIDNSRMHPSSGVIKLWEKEPESVEKLFNDVLLKNTAGDIAAVQDNMDAFMEGYENLRQKYFPRNWSYKQDRHSASVFLAVNNPVFNYAFKSSEAQMLSRYIGFGYDIGAGSTFSLENYYKLGDEVVNALKEHPRLLEKHFASLTEKHYVDKSLHLLAFDIMYCSRAYNYYKGLVPDKASKIKKKGTVTEIPAEVIAQREAERIERIQSIEQEIADLERSIDGCEDISLIGVQVTSSENKVGTVTDQSINMITVQYPDAVKKYKLDKQYSNRPRFENDDEIVEAFTQYGRAQERIKKLQKEMEKLQ